MNGPFFVRGSIRALRGYTPGEQPRDQAYIKLNTNENPYPPSPRVIEAVAHAAGGDLRLYPDPQATALRHKAAEVYGVRPEQILAGNGSDDLLSIVVRTCVDSDGFVVYPTPTYSLYDTLVEIQGAKTLTVPFGTSFELPVDRLSAHAAPVTFVCNPNAPSGTLTPVSVLEDLARRLDGLLVIDEAYVDFAGETALPLVHRYRNVLVLRTFSKSFSLAGMRIGLAFGAAEVIAELDKVKDSYNLNRLSQVAGIAALDDYRWMQANVEKIKATRAALTAGLRELGFRVPRSEANFVLAQADEDMQPVQRALKTRGVLVRHFATPSLSAALRISVGTDEENGVLLRQLKEVIPRSPR